MTDQANRPLRRGWTTGACATAATRAALMALWGDGFPDAVTITLPRGETPTFPLAHRARGVDWAEVGITKDAGDDPDVTHGALVIARVTAAGKGVSFQAGAGVGTVTMPGLPVPVGEPAINPVPRAMMTAEVLDMAARHGRAPDITITLSIPGGEILAQRTWNPRLGIVGGLSVLGTTGIVRPFSCAAWIASIHRGIDVARASGLSHVAGSTGATSEAAVQRFYGLPDHAMLDMGDFAGGMLKYLRRHPVARLTIGGGLGKLAKLGQGAQDLHSARSQVDMARLSARVGRAEIAGANTVLDAYQQVGDPLASVIAEDARDAVRTILAGTAIVVDVLACDRSGQIIGHAQ